MRTPTLHRAKIAHKECEWKDGDRGGLAQSRNSQDGREEEKHSYKKEEEKRT